MHENIRVSSFYASSEGRYFYSFNPSMYYSIGDRELIMSTYPMSQNLQVAPRLLSGNGGT